MAAKAKRKRRADPIEAMATLPTPEQLAGGEFHRVRMAYRRKPVIDSLFDQKKLTYQQYAALAYYRNQACQAEDDLARSSTLAPERVNGGGKTSGPSLHIVFTSAIAETGRIERDLGSLSDIARAIAVDDLSLSQWCIKKHGGRERYDGKGRFVAMVPVKEKETIAAALLELRFAASRIAA